MYRSGDISRSAVMHGAGLGKPHRVRQIAQADPIPRAIDRGAISALLLEDVSTDMSADREAIHRSWRGPGPVARVAPANPDAPHVRRANVAVHAMVDHGQIP